VGLVLIPLSAFFQDKPKSGFARICTAKSDATLEACAKALKLAGAVSPNKS
jgi:aspartate/methionine/tyrosine aminotransferase